MNLVIGCGDWWGVTGTTAKQSSHARQRKRGEGRVALSYSVAVMYSTRLLNVSCGIKH